MKIVSFLPATFFALSAVISSAREAAPNVGLENMAAIERLPELETGVQVHYIGSIDRRGGNADWDWWLYQDANGEWVLLDVDGPGCLYNFVQHRYPTSEEPVFRFYFDGETKPRFEIKPSEFGGKFPFVEPLAGQFEGDDIPPHGRGPIRVVRSFVPMPFHKSLKITSSVKLEGSDKKSGQGGWGHAIYHTYAGGEGVVSFTGRENYEPLLKLWRNVGTDPKPVAGNVPHRGHCALGSGGTQVLLDEQSPGSIASIEFTPQKLTREMFGDIWISLYWNGEARPAVQCPIGAFFGNEFGIHPIAFITHGQRGDGSLYNYFPMPFEKSARVVLENRGTRDIALDYAIQVKPAGGQAAANSRTTFRATTYYPPTLNTPGTDSVIGRAAGRGKIVAGTLAGRPWQGRYVSCEGDVRAYFDGISFPQMQSDGSESYGCYGWGFVRPPQDNPSSGYDGYGAPTYAFSETRVLTGDWYPFKTGFEFGIEAGNRNDTKLYHSGIIFYYGTDRPGMKMTDTLEIGNKASETEHHYVIEGQKWSGKLTSEYNRDDSWKPVEAAARSFTKQSEFTVAIDPKNQGVRLRRRSDQSIGRQRVRVFVDGASVEERSWYWPDFNPFRRWLEDEYEIPASYTRGKSSLRIRLVNVAGKDRPWSESAYWVYSY